MATATKSQARRTKAKKAAEADDDPQRSDEFATSLSEGLAEFGFDVPTALIQQWTSEAITNVDRALERWRDEFTWAATDTPVADADRVPVPPLLTSLEAVSNKTVAAVAAHAHDAALEHPTGDVPNPYPPGTAVAKIWWSVFKTAQESPPSDGPKPEADATKPAAGQPGNSNLADAAQLNAERAARQREDRLIQQQNAIDSAQTDLNEAVAHQAELEEQIVDAKAELSELNAAFKNAGQRARKAWRVLKNAKEGIFERNLPFPQDKPADALNVPDANIGSSPAVASPPPPQQDEGAFVSLAYLVKGQLQEYIPGTDPELGISQKELDSLLKVLDGETIGALEKFQKDNGGGEWWSKAMADKNVGLGKAKCEKIQLAQEVIRRKYPIPDPSDPTVEPDAFPDLQPIDVATAAEALEKLVRECKRVEDNCQNQDGVKFAADVAKQATSMGTSLIGRDGTELITIDQSRAIRNWTNGVENWTINLDPESEFGEGIDEDDEVEVPDADGEEVEDSDEE